MYCGMPRFPERRTFFDLGQFGPSDWDLAKDASAKQRALENVDASLIDPRKIVTTVGTASISSIEWRFAPIEHSGATSVHLLFRKTAGSLTNSFLTIMPPNVTGRLSNADIVARIFSPDARHASMLHVFQGWVIARLESFSHLDFYMAAIYRNAADTSDVASIWRMTRGTFALKVVARLLGNKIDWTKPWYCRFNLDGPSLKARWWNYDVAEPSLWDLSGSDSAIARPGMMGLASTIHGAIANNIWGLDWYAWSSDPAVSAPLSEDQRHLPSPPVP